VKNIFKDKVCINSCIVLILPTFGKGFEVICDASLAGIGTILLQNGKPIAFESCKLTPIERNYIIGEQELIVIVHAMQTWSFYLKGTVSVMIMITIL
jgi:hypothetical protein